MEKESRFLLQQIDCNCNDCKFMIRDFDTYNKWAEFHRKIEQADFDRRKSLGHIRAEAVFQFDKSTLIQYGRCSKFDKNVSFIPNTCQIETQECFVHRKAIAGNL